MTVHKVHMSYVRGLDRKTNTAVEQKTDAELQTLLLMINLYF